MIREYFHNAVGHFKTITKHKLLVMRLCFSVGLYKQGLLHDLSKYSFTEFKTGIKYYKGYKSPNGVERILTGTSPAWLHHKGRNKHHFEYWCDYDLENVHRMIGCRMPYRYVAEMFCDRVAASKNYLGEKYTDASPYIYYEKMRNSPLIHEKTRKEIEYLLTLLKDQGEKETLRYLRQEVKRRRKEKEFF